MSRRFSGLVAATFTPMHPDGSLRLGRVGPMVEHLLARGISGLYVCGSTGEGPSLTGAERRQVLEAFLSAARGRIPIMAHVGHNSLAEAAELARHAAQAGAAAISATPPTYWKPDSVSALLACMAGIAAGAPQLPFYYYHIPRLSGVPLDMAEFLAGGEAIPNLGGIKFASPSIADLQACLKEAEGRYEILWGVDEMLMFAWLAGARGAVGSMYNYAPALFASILSALEVGELERARALQDMSVALIRRIARGHPLAGQKAVMRMVGLDCGPARLPLPALSAAEEAALEADLRAFGLLDFAPA